FGLLLVPVGLATLAPAGLVIAGLVLICAGMLLTPISMTSYLLLNARVPREARTEAFTIMSSALAAGGAAGSVLGGVALDQLVLAAVLGIPACAGLVAGVIASTIGHD
ncbi:MAG TPA: hypothetical protein VGC42_29670, partial [Kofleriaceae bacterium]